jgi:hypothetical protein
MMDGAGRYELTREDVKQLALSVQGVQDLKNDVAEIKRLLTEDKRNCSDCKKEIFVELNTIKTQHAEERGASIARTNIGVLASSSMGVIAVAFSIWNSLKGGS